MSRKANLCCANYGERHLHTYAALLLLQRFIAPSLQGAGGRGEKSSSPAFRHIPTDALVRITPPPILFHRSLAENIAYGRPDALMEGIEEAARLANAHEFILRQPKGYHTLVGERGVKLSGGERQRVALARAFLANSPVLVLGEAASSLDSESEALIQEAMERLMTGRTSIIIAHRLSTVRILDRIVVFEQGRVIEEGTHEELVEHEGGTYKRLFERQALGLMVDEAKADDEKTGFDDEPIFRTVLWSIDLVARNGRGEC